MGYHGGHPHAGNCRACVAAGEHEVIGLGDAVAFIAQPIARGLDAVLKTKLAECGGCRARKETLNKLANTKTVLTPK